MIPSNGRGNGRHRGGFKSKTRTAGSNGKAATVARTRTHKTKRSDQLNLKDRLSQLTLDQAKKLIGADGARLIIAGSKRDLSPIDNVYLGDDLFRLTIPGAGRRPEAIVTITLIASSQDRLHWNCTACSMPCEHVGAAFSMILEEKTALGLAIAPDTDNPPSSPASDEELISLALEERQERARAEAMKVQSLDPSTPY